MATSAEVVGIHHLSPTPMTPPPQEGGSADSAVGVAIEEEYYDVMMVGITGQGKTTTSDKMLVANPSKELAGQSEREHKRTLTVKDLTLWTISRTPKDLNDFGGHDPHQTLHDPQKYLDDFRKAQELNPITSSCQLISNELSRMRILDVPGFFGVPVHGEIEQTPWIDDSSSPLEKDIHKFTCNHLAIMRDILRVQSTMRMKFKRILYFLPVKGPLVRPSMVLRQELILLARYFGRSIFESMVLVATVSSHLSKMDDMQGKLFTDSEAKTTRTKFQETLRDILGLHPDSSTPYPPVIFISLLDTGEEIVDMVRRADVQKNSLELIFDPGVCVKCSCIIHWLESERVEVIPTGKKASDVLPYSESRCHPIFLPRNRHPHKIEKEFGITYVLLSQHNESGGGNSSEEVCHRCKQPPGTEGCMKVGEVYTMELAAGGSAEVKVDHTNHIEQHRALHQTADTACDDDHGVSVIIL